MRKKKWVRKPSWRPKKKEKKKHGVCNRNTPHRITINILKGCKEFIVHDPIAQNALNCRDCMVSLHASGLEVRQPLIGGRGGGEEGGGGIGITLSSKFVLMAYQETDLGVCLYVLMVDYCCLFIYLFLKGGRGIARAEYRLPFLLF